MPNPRSARGQAAVEFVTLLPLIVVLLACAWQLVLAAHTQWSASAAARAAARAHAIGSPELAAARRSLPHSLDRRVTVRDGEGGGVAVEIRIPTIVPGLALGSLTAHATFAEQR